MAGKGGGRDYGSSVRIRAHAFKVLAPEPLVGSILGGRGGITQKEEIQNDTGARLTLSNRDEHYPHSRLRLIIVHADESGQVLSALDRLVDKVVECGSMEREGSRGEGEFLGSKPGEIVFRVALPSVIDDRVIGRNGEGLLQLADETGARVTADHEFYDGHFMVQLVGVTDVIRQCLDRLMAEVDTVNGEEPFAQWAAVRAFPGSGGGGGGHSGGHTGGHTSGAVGAPPPRRDPPDNRDARRPAPEPVSSSRYSERGGGIGSSSRSGRPSLDDSSLRPVGEPPSSSSYGMGNNSDHGYGGRPRSQAPTGSSGGRSERGRSNDIGGGGGRKSAATAAAAVPQNPMLEAMSLIAELFPEGGLDVDYLITCELPARRCGALIGKKGDYVDYVERMSGCKIKFDAEDKQGPGDSTRRLTITGKLLGVYVSHALMMKRFLDTEANERLRSEDDKLRPQLEALHQSWASGSSVRGRGTSAPADRPTLGPASGTGDRDRESLRDRGGGGGGISSSQRDNEGDSYDIERLKRLRRTALEAGYITDGRAHRNAGDRHRSGQRPRGSSDHGRSERRSRSRRQSSRGRSRGAYPPAEPSRSGERHRDDGMRHQPRESDHHMSTSQRRQFPDRSGAQQEAPPSYEAEPRRERERYRDQAPQQQPRQQQQQQQQQQMQQQPQMQQPQMQQPQMQPPQMQQPQLPEMRTADATVSAFLRYVFGANEVLTVQDANGTRAMGRFLPPPISSWDDAIAKGYISTTVRSGLVAAGMTYPTPVQNQIVPLVAAPAAVDVLIEAPAGCGKTFGVVLPLVARLAARTPPLRPHMPGSPAAVAPLMLVLLPNRDVASHVGQRVRDVAMSAHPDLKVLTLSGGDDLPMQIQAIERNQFDILCATPETLRHCINAGMLKLGFLQSIVLDDADQLLEVPHLQVIEQLFNSPELPAQDRQTVLIARFFFEELAVAATQLVRRVPELAALQAALDAPAVADTQHGGGHPEGESLVEHRVGWISNVEELWESLGQDVGELLQGCNPSCRRLLVFVNSFEQTQAVANYLRQDPHRLNCLEWPVGLGAEAQQAAMQSVYNSPSCVIVVAHGDSIALDLQALQAAGAGAILQMELPRAIDSYHGRVACLAAGVALSYATERDEAMLPDVRQAMLDAGSQAPLWMSSSAETW